MRGARAYQQVSQSTAVSGARPVDLTILLYEKLLDLFVEAKVTVETNDIERRARVTSKAIEIIETGLLAALDFNQGGEISVNLRKLYRFWIAEIMSFNLTKNTGKLAAISGQLKEVLSAFKEVRNRDPASLS
ncbi:MAG: flagellar export chaperone FliS [Betaproteobacteria bacterium]|nr:flagellar export chaperone FliS [Betaproteobacteria bacterium]NBT06401.1 flagellar export chaperone FliS [Betaproteobacteria bacterium]NBY54962.1 flagellar export chaperone FliS [Betaproteobacteria bacterium]